MERLLLRRIIQVFIITGSIICILCSIFIYQLKVEDAQSKLDEMLEQVQLAYSELHELTLEKQTINQDNYLKRAYSIAFFLENNSDLQSNEYLQKIKKLLEVESIQIIDDQGNIVLSSEEESIGINLLENEEAKPFWDLIQSDDVEDYVIQEEAITIHNYEENSYIGVKTTIEGFSVVQIGIDKSIFENMGNEEQIVSVLQQIPTLYEEAIVAVNGETGEVEGFTINNEQAFDIGGMEGEELITYLQNFENGSITRINGKFQLLHIEQLSDGTFICTISEVSALFLDCTIQIFIMIVGMLLFLLIFYYLLRKYVRKYILNDFHRLEKDIKELMLGNYDVQFSIVNDTELNSFSRLLNHWKDSYKFKELRMSRIIGALDTHVAVFECLYSININFFSKNLVSILGIEEDIWKDMKDSCARFEEYILQLQKQEDDHQLIYINGKYVTICCFKEEQEFYGVIIDRTEDIMAVDHIRNELQVTKQLAQQDRLTGLLNRRGFEIAIQQSLDVYENQGTLLIFDLDNFKFVNDKMGHPEGDRLLQDFAQCIQKFFQKDDILARLGGDEFVVFLQQNMHKHDLEILLTNCIAHLRSNLHYYYKKFQVSASIGAVTMDETSYTYEELYKMADVALYIAKHKGKDVFYINDQHNICAEETCSNCIEDCDRKRQLNI